MKWIGELWRRLAVFFRRGQFHRELEEEMSEHLRMKAKDLHEEGTQPDEARNAARREFGNPLLLRERSRDAWAFAWPETILQDLRYGLRQLRRNPGFTAVAVITLALGIGANSAIFSFMNTALLNPLPGIQNSNLLAGVYRFYMYQGQQDFDTLSYPNFQDLRDKNTVFSGLLAYRDKSVDLGGRGEAERVQGEMVTANYFEVLGVRITRGRGFLPEEDTVQGARPVAVVGYDLWKRRFESDASLMGKTIRINDHPFTVVGIAPSSFSGVEVGNPVDLWVPLMVAAEVWPKPLGDWQHDRDDNWLSGIGRLKPGISIKQAEADLRTIARRLELADPKANKGVTVGLYPRVGIDPGLRAELRSDVGLLMGIVALVLLIACANLANLLLAKSAARRKELAVRLAVGATRRRLIRQMLTESVLLALLAGGAGLLLALWGARSIAAFPVIREFFPALDPTLDARVLAFTFSLATLAGIAFGVAPALQRSRQELSASLKEGQPQGGYRKSRMRSGLVISQVAVSLMLLIGAGLLLRTFRNYVAINPGFDVRNILMMSFDVGLERYRSAQGERFFQRLVGRVGFIPGVRSASLTNPPPVNLEAWGAAIVVPGHEPSRQRPWTAVHYSVVTPGYFETLGIPVLRGRGFGDEDKPGAPAVALVNETMARRLWPNGGPIGEGFWMSEKPGQGPFIRVVGVVRDSKYRSLGEMPTLFLYLPLAQHYEPYMTLLVRTGYSPMGALPSVRRVVHSLDPRLPISDLATMSEHVELSLGEQRMMLTLASVFGLLALILAVVGIYGAISYAVAQRTHEIGIRMALGAQRKDILRMVLENGIGMALLGVGLGLLGALAFTRFLSSLLYRVKPADPLTFLTVSLILVGAAALACYFPAKRAMRVDPMVALRYE
jgi:macrolide transport system ATP-binding/permease protein